MAHSRLLPYAVQEVGGGGTVIERKNTILEFVLVREGKSVGSKEGVLKLVLTMKRRGQGVLRIREVLIGEGRKNYWHQYWWWWWEEKR